MPDNTATEQLRGLVRQDYFWRFTVRFLTCEIMDLMVNQQTIYLIRCSLSGRDMAFFALWLELG
jgi:hypothetical protein